jgi:hypothetical protein
VTQAPFSQIQPGPLVAMQLVAQFPQCEVSLPKLASQPSPGSRSQSLQSVSQVPTTQPTWALQSGVACGNSHGAQLVDF